MKATKEILIKARAIIEKRENWTQGRYSGALNPETNRVEAFPLDVSTCFCATGAIAKAAGVSVSTAEKSEPWALLVKALHGQSPDKFNDYSTHEAVLAKFDQVISSLQ